ERAGVVRAWAERAKTARPRVRRCAAEYPDHRHRRQLPSRALHLDREQQTAATDQCDKLTPLAVEHRGLPPLCVTSAVDRPVRSVFRTSSLPQRGPQVLGANLKCSESSRRIWRSRLSKTTTFTEGGQ